MKQLSIFLVGALVFSVGFADADWRNPRRTTEFERAATRVCYPV